MEPRAEESNIRIGPLSYRRYWLRLYKRDVMGAESYVDEALRVWSPQRIYMRLFQPALALSGTLFAKGRVGYGDEHFVTYQTLRFMRRVRRQFVPEETSGPLAMASGVGQDSHVIGLRMVCDFLKWANWRIHWLIIQRPGDGGGGGRAAEAAGGAAEHGSGLEHRRRPRG